MSTRTVIAASLATVLACGAPAKPPPPPPPPTCAATADHVKKLVTRQDERAQRLRDAFAERCERDGWAGEVRICITSTESLAKPRSCKDQLTGLQRAALDRAIAEAEVTGPQGPCQRYFAAGDRFARCSAIPASTREAYKSNIDSMRERYADPEVRKELEESCEEALEGLESLMEQCD